MRRTSPASSAKICAPPGNGCRRRKRLLTVKTDCPLPVEAADLKIAPPDVAALKALYQRFEFKSWLRDLPGAGNEDAMPGADAGSALADMASSADTRTFTARDTPVADAPAAVPRHYETVLDAAAFARWRDAIAGAELVSFDTETTSLDPMQARIVGLSFAIEPGRACYIPLGHRYPGAPDQLAQDEVLRALAPWFADPAARKLGQNVKYDEHVLANHGLVLAGVTHDTLLQSYVLESHKPHDMDNLAWRHLNVKTIAYADVTGKGAARIGFDQVSVEDATAYSAEDADITLQLHRVAATRGSSPMRGSTTSTRRSSSRCATCCS